MGTVKDIVKAITRHAYKQNIERHNTINAWLDYMIEYFDASQYLTRGGYERMQKQKYQESEELYMATYMWMEITADNMEKGQASDVIGAVYEELFQSRGKASSLGQFFTPVPLCDVITICSQEGQMKVNDNACGSGRTLVSHYMERVKSEGISKAYYIGEDIDISSVKMCALNMMIHGMRGRAIRHDALTERNFDYGLEVNEVRYPFPSMFYSVRKIQSKT